MYYCLLVYSFMLLSSIEANRVKLCTARWLLLQSLRSNPANLHFWTKALMVVVEIITNTMAPEPGQLPLKTPRLLVSVFPLPRRPAHLVVAHDRQRESPFPLFELEQAISTVMSEVSPLSSVEMEVGRDPCCRIATR